MIPVLRPALFGFLLAQLLAVPGAARWIPDPLGLGAAGLAPVPPGPLAPVRHLEDEAAKAMAAHVVGNAHLTLERLSRVVLLHPDEPSARRAFGSRLLAEGENEAAIAQFRAALRLDPLDAAAWHELAWAEAGALHSADSLESAAMATKLMPGWAAAHLRQGTLLLRAGQERPGYDAINRALACAHVPPEIYYEIGNMYLEQGAAKDAIPYYEEALRWRPGYSFAANNLGNAFKALKEPLKARRCYEAAMASDPANPNPRNALGVLLQEQGDLTGALEAYREAAKLDPAYADARYNAGVLLLHQGKVNEALTDLAAASRLNPSLAVAHVQLGEAHFRLGHVRLALDSYMRAMSLDPNLKTKAAECRRLLGERRP
ncbi:MAG: tetratricopeptide repeat protein [Candidatus Sericytochromatia bacterium]